MSLLRRISTHHLLALCASVIAVAVGGTAIASALGGEGQPPPPQPLAQAVHQAITAAPVTGVSARIEFTNHLVDSASLVGSDPLLTGAKGRLWYAPGQHRLRLELDSSRGVDSQLVLDNGKFWFYDDAMRTVYRGALPQHAAGASQPSDNGSTGAKEQPPSVADIQRVISRLTQHVSASDPPRSGAVAGHGAYTLSLSPHDHGGLLGAAELAWDAARGVPLRLAVYAKNNPSPVLELKATEIKYGPLGADSFSTTPPQGSKIVDVQTSGSGKPDGAQAGNGHAGDHAPVIGLSAVQAQVPFQISAPGSLNGLPRHEVRLLRFNGSPGALVTYGQGLGSVAVLERTHTAGPGGSPGAAPDGGGNAGGQGKGHDQGQGLPAIQIKEATGHELATALGTLITFQRPQGASKVDYVVAGSVPSNVAEAAARAL